MALGVSSFFHGFYDPLVWVPIGVGLVVVMTAAALAITPQVTRPAWCMLSGLLGLAVWSVLSTRWSDSVERALVESNRTVVLFAILACALLLIRSNRASKWLLIGLGTGIAVVGLYICLELFGSNPSSQFSQGRLNLPLGYFNAQGTVFAMGFWIFVAAAERRHPLIAAFGAGGAALMVALSLLSQSRGVVVALLVSALLVFLLAPGRLRRAGLLAVVGVGFALTAGKMLAIYHAAAQAGSVPVSVAHTAGAAITLSVLGTVVVWGGLVAVHNAQVQRRPELTARLREAAVFGLAAAGLVVVIAAAASASSIRHEVGAQWSAFTHLSDPTTVAPQTASSRLLSGAGNRADYWRVAWHAWLAHPVRGYGAGNYDVPYFQSRRTAEPVRQPHSIELQALSELGLVGFGFLALFVGAIATGAWRMRERARVSLSERTLMVAALGVTSAWFIHTSVDWIHLIPGATGVALVAAAILTRGPDGGPDSRGPNRATARRSATLAVLGGSVLLFATVSLTRQGVSDVFADRAQNEVASRPASAIRDADSALRLDPYKVESYYTKAAALDHFGQAIDARAALLSAASQEPNNFVTWVLLGDIATRTGNSGLAASFYARASALNPREPALAR